METIHNPVEAEAIRARAREPLDHPWFAADAAPVLLGVGKLKRQKDFGTLLRAFARVRKERAAHLLLLGEGEQRPQLLALARELGIEADVQLHGFVANPAAYMARASVFVLSSAWEGFEQRAGRGPGLRLSRREHRLPQRPRPDPATGQAGPPGAGGRRCGHGRARSWTRSMHHRIPSRYACAPTTSRWTGRRSATWRCWRQPAPGAPP